VTVRNCRARNRRAVLQTRQVGVGGLLYRE